MRDALTMRDGFSSFQSTECYPEVESYAWYDTGYNTMRAPGPLVTPLPIASAYGPNRLDGTGETGVRRGQDNITPIHPDLADRLGFSPWEPHTYCLGVSRKLDRPSSTNVAVTVNMS